MKKNIIITILILIIIILSIPYLNKNKENDKITLELDNLNYNYKVLPILNKYLPNLKIDENILNKSGINRISNFNNEIRILFNENYTSKAFFCVYIYSKEKYKNLEHGKIYKDKSLYNEFGAKFSTGKFTKINDNYGKYCLYHIF